MKALPHSGREGWSRRVAGPWSRPGRCSDATAQPHSGLLNETAALRGYAEPELCCAASAGADAGREGSPSPGREGWSRRVAGLAREEDFSTPERAKRCGNKHSTPAWSMLSAHSSSLCRAGFPSRPTESLSVHGEYTSESCTSKVSKCHTHK